MGAVGGVCLALQCIERTYMARHPNQLSPFVDYRPKAKDPKAGVDAYERPEVTRERDLASLKAAQASRPMKPPGKR